MQGASKILKFSFKSRCGSCKRLFLYNNKLSDFISSPNALLPKRLLFSSEHLGIDGFQRQRFLLANVPRHEKAAFFDKVKEQFASPSNTYQPQHSNSFTYTEDLKLALNLAENDEEVDLVVKMTINYNSQKLNHKHLNYVFGPLIFRLLHLFNKPITAYELYMNPLFQQTSFFSQTSSRTVLLDMLLENSMHQALVDVFNSCYLPSSSSSISQSSSSPTSSTLLSNISSPLTKHRISSDHLVLLAASCFRQNTKECLNLMKSLFFERSDVNVEYSSRTFVYAGMLAYMQGEPKIGLELLRMMPKHSKSTTSPAYLNSMVLLLAASHQTGKAVVLLEAMVAKMDVFQEVLEKVKEHAKGNQMLSDKLNTVTENLRNAGTLLPISFHDYLNSTIRVTKDLQNSAKKSRIGRAGVDRSSGYFPPFRSRPGIK